MDVKDIQKMKDRYGDDVAAAMVMDESRDIVSGYNMQQRELSARENTENEIRKRYGDDSLKLFNELEAEREAAEKMMFSAGSKTGNNDYWDEDVTYNRVKGIFAKQLNELFIALNTVTHRYVTSGVFPNTDHKEIALQIVMEIVKEEYAEQFEKWNQ